MCIKLLVLYWSRVRAADIPISPRSGSVQIDRSTTVRTIPSVATDKRNRKAKHRKAHTISLYIHFLFTLQGGIAPPIPLCGYAAKGSSQEGEPPIVQ